MVRILSAVVLAAVTAMPVAAQDKPSNTEFIAPASPGGGWDFICRTVAKRMREQDLVDGAMQVTNMTGGGVAFAYVMTKRSDDASLIVAASNGTTTRLAQGAYPGATEDDVRWLASFGAEYGVVAVDADSEIQGLSQLVAMMKEDPRSVSFAGGSAVGGYDHLKILMMAKEAELEDVRQVKYVAFSGGGEAMTQVLSGAITAFSGDFSEVRGFVDSGDIKILAVLAPERLQDFDQYPTAKEQGINVVGANWRGLYVPKGISDEQYAFWQGAVEKMVASEEFKEIRAAAGIEPLDLFGAEAQAYVSDNVAEIRALSKEIGLIQ